MALTKLKSKRYKVIVFVTCCFLLATSVYLLFSLGLVRFNYPSETQYPIKGIDISHHQESINWDELKKENLAFIYIKATEGADHKDGLFERNLRQAKLGGYKTGAYHFYLFCKSPQEQAENFIETVALGDCTLPPAIDVEFGGFCKVGENDEDLLPDLETFVTILTKHYGKPPVIYTTNSFYKKYLKNKLSAYPLWIRSVFGQPKLEDGRTWTFWQYTDKGKLNGIKEDVDLNVFCGNTLSNKKD